MNNTPESQPEWIEDSRSDEKRYAYFLRQSDIPPTQVSKWASSIGQTLDMQLM